MSARRPHHRPSHGIRQRAPLALALAVLGFGSVAACREPRPAAGNRPSTGGGGERGEGFGTGSAGSRGSKAASAEKWRAGAPGVEDSTAGASPGGVATGGHANGDGNEAGEESAGAGAGAGVRVGAGAGAGAGTGTGMGTGTERGRFGVVSCGGVAGSEGCVLSGEGTELVVRGDVLAPGTVFEGGVVRLDASGTIVCVGCDCGGPPAREVACAGAVVSPAFTNPHDHVAYAAEAPRADSTERYEHRHDWRLGLRGHAAVHYEGGAPAVVRAAHELRMLLGGATTLAGGAGHEGLVRNPDVSGLGEGLPTAPADSETFPLDDADGRLLASGCAYGSDHARASDVERVGGYLAHLGEGIDAEAENELDCALTTEFGLIDRSTAVVHAVAVRAARAAALGARGARVVWSPRSNVALYGNTAPVPLLLRSGIEVALGTDWLLTGSMNLLRELDCARRLATTYFDGIPDDYALWQMVTSAAARAVGAGDALGRLERGYLGDVLVIARRGREPFAAAVGANPEDFELILRGGTALYGRRDLVEALRPGACDALEVCGRAQAICAGDSGYSLAELASAAAETYPLFACDAPPNEPTCVPARAGEYNGAPSADDGDGDGIGDALDRCPDVFDPVRPVDDDEQADADGDGQGDACDPCPLDVRLDCSDARTGDRDGDTVADGADVCPDARDPEQSDGDGDGRGDACDFCPGENPGIFPCILTVAGLRDRLGSSRPPRHALVGIEHAVVTALRPATGNARGFYLEDRAGPLSGLFVYTGSTAPEVALGDRVALAGRLDEYYGVDQLVLGALLAREPGPEPLPLDVEASVIGDASELAGDYDSLLVRVTQARVVDTNPDAPSDYDETGLAGGLRLDDLLLPELDNDLAAGTSFSAVTGIAGISFEHRKVWPRTAADFEP